MLDFLYLQPPLKSTHSALSTIYILSNVSGFIWPNFSSLAIRKIILPITFVGETTKLHQFSFTNYNTIFELPNKITSIRKKFPTFTMWSHVFGQTFIHWTIRVVPNSLKIWLTKFPLANINCIRFKYFERSIWMRKAILVMH